MSAHCCGHHHQDPRGARLRQAAYRQVLWWVLAINALMFAVEIGAGLAAGSAALQADALDFLGDAANYAISLFVVGMALRYRATAALAKGATMALFRLWVLGVTAWHVLNGTLPHAVTMGGVGLTALVADAGSFWLLWQHRTGDANMRSAWICTRNDVLGNLGAIGGSRRVRDRDRLARRDRGRCHGHARSARGGDDHQAGQVRAPVGWPHADARSSPHWRLASRWQPCGIGGKAPMKRLYRSERRKSYRSYGASPATKASNDSHDRNA